MNIEIKSSYNIVVPVNKSINFDIKEYLNYIRDTTFSTINQLKWDIDDYICNEKWDNLYDTSNNNIVIDYDSIEFTIENLDELYKHLEYLIDSPKIYPLSCCTGQTGNYCSQCGKKLK